MRFTWLKNMVERAEIFIVIDGHGRTIDYLRISIIDRCNLRCVYCMPEQGVDAVAQEEILSYEEILRLVKVFAELGICKIKRPAENRWCEEMWLIW